MKKLSFFLTIFLSLQLTAAEQPQQSWWSRFKNNVSNIFGYGQRNAVGLTEHESKESAAFEHGDFDDEKMTKGDYVAKYGFAVASSVLNAKMSHDALVNVRKFLKQLQDGASFYDVLESFNIDDQEMRAYFSQTDMLPPALQKLLEQIKRVLNDERFCIRKNERSVIKELIFDGIEDGNREATEYEKSIIKNVRAKLKNQLTNEAFNKRIAVPIYAQAAQDTIEIAGSAAAVAVTGTDIVSPFKDTLGWAVSQQVLADAYPKNKKFKIKPRELGESLLTDACYAVTKFTVDEAFNDAYGVKCRYPWSRKSSFIHYFAAGIVETIARHAVKSLMQTYLIKPFVSSIFGEPVSKKKKIKNAAQMVAVQRARTLKNANAA